MKVKDLIEKIQQVDQDSTVFINTDIGVFNFSGLSVDDNNDIELYIVHGDEEA